MVNLPRYHKSILQRCRSRKQRQFYRNSLTINYRLSIPVTDSQFALSAFLHYRSLFCMLYAYCFQRGGPLSYRLMLCDAMRTTQDETKLRPITNAGGFLFYRDAKADYFSALQSNGKTTRTGRKAILATAIVIYYRTHDYDSVSTTSRRRIIHLSQFLSKNPTLLGRWMNDVWLWVA